MLLVLTVFEFDYILN